jgi:hypothetical protein
LDVISISSAIYGRQDPKLCASDPERMKNVNCEYDAINQVKNSCNNKSSCRFAVGEKEFVNDPCPDTRKYIKISFQCVKYIFDEPGDYFVVSPLSWLSILGSDSGQVWTVDPLDENRFIYQLVFSTYQTTELRVFETLNHMATDDRTKTINLPLPAADTKFVVWNQQIYYPNHNGDTIIKYSIGSSDIDGEIKIPEIVAQSLFRDNDNVQMVQSEFGVFGEALSVIYLILGIRVVYIVSH